MGSIKYVLCAAALLATVQTAAAQTPSFALEVRGGGAIPIGDWNDEDVLDPGYGFGGNVRAMVTPTLGVYAGYEMYTFPIDLDEFGDIDIDAEDAGFRGGLALEIPMAGSTTFAPYVELGVIYNTTTISASDGSASEEIESEASVGFEGGLGVAIPLGQKLSVTPAVRYRTHELEVEGFDGGSNAAYVSFDIGLRLRL